ncbi:cold shock domain-containing protein [Serinicoccus sp. CUA-874]|uniref:cold-shock protein n=1 Tax=Serinicoccus sp. CUA-874 TaxID=1517939 RepID=UPI000AF1DCA8|nr:cold shock domain-containing protein [Serinicoccus sp. CUA-874]
MSFDTVDSERARRLATCGSSVGRHVGAHPRGRRPAPAPGRGGRPTARPEGARAWSRYDADRGFGFITPDAGGADLFVHVSVLRDVETLEPGDRVRYQVRQSDRGPQADRLELL